MPEKPLLPESGRADWPDGLPPCLIHVDKDGRFWHLGAEMIHRGINKLLAAHVTLDEKGCYVIVFNGQRCFVEVEDTFFVVVRVETRAVENGSIGLELTLNDGTTDLLDPATLSQNQENVLYARVKQDRFPARFSRSSYYQLAEHVEEVDGRFVLALGGDHYPICIQGERCL